MHSRQNEDAEGNQRNQFQRQNEKRTNKTGILIPKIRHTKMIRIRRRCWRDHVERMRLERLTK